MVAGSGQPNDMRATRKAAESGNADAGLALQVFTRSVRKAIGAFAWLLGGLDAVVFTALESTMESPGRDLRGLESSGVVLNAPANEARSDALRRVSGEDSQVDVWVVTAQEDHTIAVHVSNSIQRRNDERRSDPSRGGEIRATDRR